MRVMGPCSNLKSSCLSIHHAKNPSGPKQMDRSSFVVACLPAELIAAAAAVAVLLRQLLSRKTVRISRLALLPPERGSSVESDAELLAASTPLKHIVVPPLRSTPMPSQDLHDVPLHPLAPPPPKDIPHPHHVVHENHPAAGPQVKRSKDGN